MVQGAVRSQEKGNRLSSERAFSRESPASTQLFFLSQREVHIAMVHQSSKGNLYNSFPLTDFSPTPTPFLGKFKRHRKVKLSHSPFPELTTVNIWSYFPPGFFFLRNNMFQIPNSILFSQSAPPIPASIETKPLS